MVPATTRQGDVQMAETLRVRSSKRARPPIAGVFGLFMALNPLLARFAGSKYLPLWALLRHQGRRSGHAYATPVAARRTAEGFVIPLAFGETSDWCRNVLASGRAEIRWKDRVYQLDDPVLVDIESEIAAFPAVARPLLRLGLFGEHVLRLREVTSGDVPEGSHR
ncbi:MAG: nitroreductase family deazaflavin-dependent oxidoreductase [Chloroflexi bacterium]|nr:MAG: nitroreductase family deazaflavin-dependent oxidoreductase [Chloroflexota bacterium]